MAPAPAPASRLAGSLLGHSQLQARMFERASQPGGKPAPASPPNIPRRWWGETFWAEGVAPSASPRLPVPVPDLALPFCL